MKSQAQLAFPQFKGEALTQLPDDLFIPPEALEIYLEDFSGPMDVLLYLIQKKDIDILDFNGKITKSNKDFINLEIPHPRMHNRNFVLMPLFEICKNWSHPKLKKNIVKLLSSLKKNNLRSITVI